LRFQAGMNVLLRSAAPVLAARDQFKFHHALCACRHLHAAIESLARIRQHHADAAFHVRENVGAVDDLPEVRRGDFLFPFAHQDEVHR
jgi:hypothetical protein